MVRLEDHHLVAAGRLEQPREQLRAQRVVRLGARVLARIGQIGDDGGHAGGGVRAQRRAHRQQPEDLVVRAVVQVAMQAGQHIGVLPARVGQRAPLAFAVVETALLVAGQRLLQRAGQRQRQRGVLVERVQQHGRPPQSTRTVPDATPDGLISSSAARGRGRAAPSCRRFAAGRPEPGAIRPCESARPRPRCAGPPWAARSRVRRAPPGTRPVRR